MRVSPTLVRLGAVAIVLVAAALVFLGSHPEPERPAALPQSDAGTALSTHVARAVHDDPRPDILLFTIDTLRADHVWSYGASRHTMPNLTELGTHATQYDVAYSASSWTAPGVTSILTG